jgi:hypothetical protein
MGPVSPDLIPGIERVLVIMYPVLARDFSANELSEKNKMETAIMMNRK